MSIFRKIDDKNIFDKKRYHRVTVNTMEIVSLGFLGVILLGALLLYLPISNQQPIAFIDALFTATTAVCVTGLVTIVPAAQFTIFGKVILLILIQVGGLGVIAMTICFFMLLKHRLSMKQSVMVQQAYGLDDISSMNIFILRIFKGTFIVEGAGAILYAFQFIPEFGWKKGITYSIFHAISAFCNAGIDILGDSSFMNYAKNPLINGTTIFLIILSGLGFIVWHDLKHNILRVFKNHEAKHRLFTKLELQTKIVLCMTAALLLIGWIFVFIMEYNNPETIGNYTLGQKLMASLFQSTTTRTAGFASFSQAALRGPSKVICCMLMFIGGSPAGTAGGVKTTTIAMLILVNLTVLRGKKDVEVFGRKLPSDSVRSAISIIMGAFIFWLLGIALLSGFDPGISFENIIYEVTSAIATVGLTADVTPNLCRASQIVIMVIMYAGRIGPSTMALVFLGRAKAPVDERVLPEKNIMIG